MNKGKYAIAEFENSDISVVPVNWIYKQDNNLFCHWTTSRQRIVAMDEPNPNWHFYRIVKIIARRRIYLKFYFTSYMH